jgi:hypothetical protein
MIPKNDDGIGTEAWLSDTPSRSPIVERLFSLSNLVMVIMFSMPFIVTAWRKSCHDPGSQWHIGSHEL